jgi:hypothetical protein
MPPTNPIHTAIVAYEGVSLVSELDNTPGEGHVALGGNHRLECQKTLEIQVGTEKCAADAKLADALFDCRVVAKKTYR